MKRALLMLLCLVPITAGAWDDLDLGGLPLSESRRTHIMSEDGVALAAWLLVPDVEQPERLPAVLFAEDWLFGTQTFLLPAVHLALRNHVVLLYQARGSGHSAGRYDLAGPDSQRDLRSAYRWLAAHPRVDAGRMGVLGASAAASTALLATPGLPGLRAMVALCPWTQLGKAIYHDGVGRPAWLAALDAQNPPRRLQANLSERLRRTLIGAPDRAWLGVRSPAAEMHVLPEVPVLFSGSFADPLQDAGALMRYAAALPGTRQLMLYQGGHCAEVLPGLEHAGEPLWEDALAWLEHWLTSDVQSVPTAHVVMETAADGTQDELLGWPQDDIPAIQLFLGPRFGEATGSLEQRIPAEQRAFSNTLQGIRNGLRGMQQIELGGGRSESAVWLPGIEQDAAIVFESRGLARTLALRGTPRLRLWLLSTAREVQLVAYLFSSSELGLGRLISKGAVAREGILPGEPFQLDMELGTMARDIAPGDHLVLVLDTDDPEYLLPLRRNFSLRLLFSEQHRSVLVLPYSGLPFDGAVETGR